MSVAAVRAIKRSRPDAHVTVVAPAKAAPVWRLVNEVDAVVLIPTKSLAAAVRAIRRQSQFDAAILLPNSLRSALEIFLARVPRRVGYRGHFRRLFLNQLVPDRFTAGPPEHHALRFLRIAERCGAETLNAQRSTSNVQLAIPSQTPHIKHQTLLALCPGAEYGSAKRWPADRFADAATLVSQKSDAKWVLLGTQSDRAVGEKIAAALGDSCTNRIGETNIEQLIEQLRECRLVLTNDTGTMHLAAFLGRPVVAIFGSTEPRLTAPLGDGHVVIRHHVECSPCFLRECPIDFRCMKAVSAHEVADAVLSILQKRSC
jgi:heptosyltransferase-2